MAPKGSFYLRNCRYSCGLRATHNHRFISVRFFRGRHLHRSRVSHRVSPFCNFSLIIARFARLGNVSLLFHEKRSITTIYLYSRENTVASSNLETVLGCSYDYYFPRMIIIFLACQLKA